MRQIATEKKNLGTEYTQLMIIIQRNSLGFIRRQSLYTFCYLQTEWRGPSILSCLVTRVKTAMRGTYSLVTLVNSTQNRPVYAKVLRFCSTKRRHIFLAPDEVRSKISLSLCFLVLPRYLITVKREQHIMWTSTLTCTKTQWLFIRQTILDMINIIIGVKLHKIWRIFKLIKNYFLWSLNC